MPKATKNAIVNTRLKFNKTLAIVVAVVVVAGGYAFFRGSQAATNGLPKSPANYRAMWVWNDNILTSTDAKLNLLAFAQAHKVNVIYFDAETAVQVPSDPKAYIDIPHLASFIGRASADNIQVEFLFAEPGWVANPAAAVSLVNKTLAFMASQPANQRPVGVTFDEEPTLTPTSEAQLLSLYTQLKSATQGKLRLGATYQLAYDGVNYSAGGVTKPMTEWVIDKLDEPILMDYRNDTPLIPGDSIASHALLSLAYANKIHKRVYLALETNNVQPPKITFYGVGNAAMEAAMKAAKRSFKGNPAWGGWVIEDYPGYAALKP